MISVAGSISPFTKISATVPTVAPDRTLSVVSLNMAKERDAGRVASTILSSPKLRDADLFLLQEVFHHDQTMSVADEAAKKLGYFSAFAPAKDANDQGLALISRYPVSDVQVRCLKACDLRFRSRSRFALTATVKTPWSALRVWNVHLDTRINVQERLEQLKPIIQAAAAETGPQLIGGDFNTNDLYWLGNVFPLPFGPAHTVSIRSAMKEHGFGTPFVSALDTFPPFRRHLDWIFLKNMQPLSSSVEQAAFSDHNAIWVQAGI